MHLTPLLHPPSNTAPTLTRCTFSTLHTTASTLIKHTIMCIIHQPQPSPGALSAPYTPQLQPSPSTLLCALYTSPNHHQVHSWRPEHHSFNPHQARKHVHYTLQLNPSPGAPWPSPRTRGAAGRKLSICGCSAASRPSRLLSLVALHRDKRQNERGIRPNTAA